MLLHCGPTALRTMQNDLFDCGQSYLLQQIVHPDEKTLSATARNVSSDPIVTVVDNLVIQRVRRLCVFAHGVSLMPSSTLANRKSFLSKNCLMTDSLARAVSI